MSSVKRQLKHKILNSVNFEQRKYNKYKAHVKELSCLLKMGFHPAPQQTRFGDYEQQRCRLIAGFVRVNALKSGDFTLWVSFKSTVRYKAVPTFAFLILKHHRKSIART